MLVLAFGLPVVIAVVGEAFIWLKLVGAAYLVWLGIGLWRNRDSFSGIESIAEKTTFKRMFLQGFFVILTNPKSLLFFGVFIPQFIDPGRNAVWQTLIFGGTFMIVATVLDGAYALLAGGAGRMLTKTRIRVLERISGTLLISGGIWLALQKRS
jgi:threonine/homoserine/homoserine lactone efflux protein